MQIVALDVHYEGDQARTGWVLFRDWADAQPAQEGSLLSKGVDAYEPGAFYKRELPFLVEVLQTLPPPDALVIDGYCWLGPERMGLGARLYQALQEACPVLGVAKTAFHGTPGLPVLRGTGRTPLYVTSCGIAPQEAARKVQLMHGSFRIPTLLKRVDQLSRGK